MARMARTLVVASAFVLTTAVLAAGAATAAPECTETGLNTTTCERPGHTAITTTPNPNLTNPGWAFWGTPAFGLGAGGFWIGI